MYRRDYQEVIDEGGAPSIPVQPISYGDAFYFMRFVCIRMRRENTSILSAMQPQNEGDYNYYYQDGCTHSEIHYCAYDLYSRQLLDSIELQCHDIVDKVVTEKL